MKESSVFQTPPMMSYASSPSNICPSMLWSEFSPPQFPALHFPIACSIQASSYPSAPLLTQLPECHDKLTSILSDSYL